MSNAMMKSVALTMLMLVGLNVEAGETANLVKYRAKTTAPVKFGQWHSNFSKAKAEAEKLGVPFVAVWSNGDACGHCITFENGCNQSYFRTWQANSGMIFFFAHSGDSAYRAGTSVFHWIRNDVNTAYPFIRLYWKKNGKLLKDVATVGDTMDKAVKGVTGAKNIVSYIKNVFKDYKYDPTPPIVYYGGAFANSDGACDTYEVEEGFTGEVDVRLMRVNPKVIPMVATNNLIVKRGDVPVVTNQIAWVEGQEEASSVISGLASFAAGETLTLELTDSHYEVIEKRVLNIVEEPENSPKNPRWKTERTADTLAWGEWTMDIDTATNKVNAAIAGGDDKAVTMLLIGGPLWCPDCVNLEERLINTAAFREWATTKHHVACVAIDEPIFASGSDIPTIFSRKTYDVSWLGGKTSGLGYMTRKGISDEEGAAICARNLDYVNKRVGEGGFLQPDTTLVNGGWKTGIPCILILRKDGSVASRLFQFSNSTEGLREEDVGNVLKRLDEMIALRDDPSEELNDGRGLTPDTVGRRETVSGKTLSFADPVDYYRLDPATLGMELTVRLDGSVDTPFDVSVVKAAGGSFSILASAEASLAGGVVIPRCRIDSTNCFIKVSYPVDGNAYPLATNVFGLASSGSTLVGYSLTTDFIVTPEEVRTVVTVDDGNPVSFNVVSGEVYRVAGTTGLEPAEAFEDLGGGFYRSVTTSTVCAGVEAGALDLQLWHPGEVGFSASGSSVSENAGVYDIAFVRRGGVSSNAMVTVTLDTAASSQLPGIIDWAHDGETLVWNEGEGEVKTLPVTILDNEFADGDQRFVFKVAVAGEAEPGFTNFVLTVKENDRPVAGKLGIAGSNPSFAKTMTVFVREGEDLVLDVGRYGGADGALNAKLSATAGTLDQTEFHWDGRNVDPQQAVLTVPARSVSKKFYVTLAAADKATKIDVNAKKLTVEVLPANAPVFADSAVRFEFPTYIPLADGDAVVNAGAGEYSNLKFAKYSGSIAPGLKMTADVANRRMVFSGMPTKPGSYSVVYRISDGSVAGGTVRVDFRIVDQTVAGTYQGSDYVANTALAKTRTFSDMIVTGSFLDDTSRRLTGLLTVTVPKNGKVSAKYRSVNGTVNLSAPNWMLWDAASGDVSTTARGTTSANAEYALKVNAHGNGYVDFLFTVPGDDSTYVIRPGKDATAAEIADWKGYYTVSMPNVTNCVGGVQNACGDGYMTLKMNTADALKRATFTYAGLLPNGKAVTGTSRLTEEWNDEVNQWDYAHVPMMYVSKTDVFTGAMRIRPGASYANATNSVIDQKCGGRCYYKQVRRSVSAGEEMPLFWIHETSPDDFNITLMDAWGGLYVTSENFVSCCSSALGSATLQFFPVAVEKYLAETSYGAAQPWSYNTYSPVVSVKYAKLNSKAKTKTNQIVVTKKKKGTAYYNPYSYAMTFTLSTGIVSGSYYLNFKDEIGKTTKVKQTFRGIVMPGWGYASCADCGYKTGGAESAERPFISGTAWFKDGKIVRSAPISIGTEEGQ